MTSDEVVSEFAGVSATALKNGAAPDTSEFNALQVDAIDFTAAFTGLSPAVQDNLSAAAREPIFADMASIVQGDVDAADAVAAVLEANAE
jgi:raffinose/stachyose/melibiose transport system substrate-binding protein